MTPKHKKSFKALSMMASGASAHGASAREAGFSLVEAVVALTLLILGLVPLAQALVSTDRGREDAERIYRMHLLAANQLETVKLSGATITDLEQQYTANPSFEIPETELAGLVGDATGSVEVTRLAAGATSALVRVHVDYTDAHGAPRRETVATVVRRSAP